MSDIAPKIAAERVAAFMAETRPNAAKYDDDDPGGHYAVHGLHVFDTHSVQGYGHINAVDLRALVEFVRQGVVA